MQRTWLLGVGVIALGLIMDPAHAQAGWTLIGSGETIAEMSEITDPAPYAEAGLQNATLGYKYSYFAIAFVPLFTGDGGYVVFDPETDRHIEIDAATVLELTGESADDIGAPLTYHVPWGWFLLGPLLAMFTWDFVQRWRSVG